MVAEMPSNYREILERFTEACQADDRVLAALLVGSYAKATADQYSDLDLYVIARQDALDDFAARRDEFVRRLGQPEFLEDFGLPGIVFVILSDGSVVDVSYVSESEASRAFSEPYRMLVDKRDFASRVEPGISHDDQRPQTEQLRRQVHWFWHEMSHFITALGRDQLWWAQGQLGALRLHCMNLARLHNDISDDVVGAEGYFKIEDAVGHAQLAALEKTLVPMDRHAMLAAALEILRIHKQLAVPLAESNKLSYPHRLEAIMATRLNDLRKTLKN